MSRGTTMEHRLRTSGMLVIAGLIAEGICLLWSRPIAFVFMAGLDGGLIFLNVAYFLYSIAFLGPHKPSASDPAAK
jgi:hypothetical protein